MKVIELEYVGRKRRREIWELELGADEVRLVDDRGDEVTVMARDEAVRRIQLPSFFMSIKNLHIYDEDQNLYEFVPAKRALADIQAYLDRTLRQDKKARTNIKSSGWALLIFGLLLLAGGTAFLVVEIARGTLLQPGRLRIASPFAGILMGVVFVAWGITQIVKARRLDRDQELSAEE